MFEKYVKRQVLSFDFLRLNAFYAACVVSALTAANGQQINLKPARFSNKKVLHWLAICINKGDESF